MEFKPHDYQKFTIEQILKKPKIALVLDMGLGKTVCTLTALDQLLFDSFEVNKVLIIAPLRVAEFTWPEELEKWDHLKNIKLSKVIGTEAERLAGLRAKADLYVVNRENTQWLVEYYLEHPTLRWPFDTIIVDESSSFKNNRSKRFKALRKVAISARRMILLTGTPAPNSLMDLWPQIFLLDQGRRLGRTITQYRSAFFDPGKRNRTVIFDYVPKPGAERQIYERIRDIAVSLKAEDHLKMPERVDNYIKLTMSSKARAVYDELEQSYLVTWEEDQITAATAAVVGNKLLQMANGAVYDSERKVIHIHDHKLDALEEILEDSEGQSVLVLYNYEHDRDRLMERFKELNPSELKTAQDKEAWDAGRIRLLIAHPASMGHGLNLQAGGHIIVWFGLTYTLENYKQANARLYRQGQKQSVIINHLMMTGTRDEHAIERLTRKDVNQNDLINNIKALIRQAKKEAKV